MGNEVAAEIALRQVALSAALHGLDAEHFVLQRAKRQYRYVRRGREDLVESVDALAVGKQQIDQDDVNVILTQPFERLGKASQPFHLVWTVVGFVQRFTKGGDIRSDVAHD